MLLLALSLAFVNSRAAFAGSFNYTPTPGCNYSVPNQVSCSNSEGRSVLIQSTQSRLCLSWSGYPSSGESIELYNLYQMTGGGQASEIGVYRADWTGTSSPPQCFDYLTGNYYYEGQASITDSHGNETWVDYQLFIPYNPNQPPPNPDCTVMTSATGITAVGQSGYLKTDGAGHVCAEGTASWAGDLAGYKLAAPVISITATPDGAGYWLLGADGGIFTYGDAHFYGSTGGTHLNAPVVGMAPTQDGKGYWIVAKDGGIFSYGDARFHGSTGNLKLAQPVVGMAVAPGGNGYWLVAADGGVFTFTNDGFYGSLGNVQLSKPIIGMSGTADGRGYTLVGSDGGVFNFGDSHFYGSWSGSAPGAVVAIATVNTNTGYYLITSNDYTKAFGPGASAPNSTPGK